MSDDADQESRSDSETTPVDPLTGLTERLKLDVKAGFTDDVIEAAAILKRSDAGKFVELLRDLKSFKRANPGSGFSLTVFNKQIDRKLAETSAIIADQVDTATRLVELSLAATYFLNPDDDATFADFIVNDQFMTGAVQGPAYQRWLQMLYYRDQHRAPTRKA
jgi:hypothetical protein